MTAVDDALVALVSVAADIDRGKLAASPDDAELIRHALDVLAQLGEEDDR